MPGRSSQVLVVEMAEPGAVMSGLKPPSSRGPREEKLNSALSLRTTDP